MIPATPDPRDPPQQGHEGVTLDPDGLHRPVAWMDVYAQRQGHFSDQQEEELRKLRQQWAEFIASGAPTRGDGR